MVSPDLPAHWRWRVGHRHRDHGWPGSLEHAPGAGADSGVHREAVHRGVRARPGRRRRSHLDPGDRPGPPRLGQRTLAGRLAAGARRRPDAGALGPGRALAASARPAAAGARRTGSRGPAHAHQPNRAGHVQLPDRLVDRFRRAALCPSGGTGDAAREHHLPEPQAGPRRGLTPELHLGVPGRGRPAGAHERYHRRGESQTSGPDRQQ